MKETIARVAASTVIKTAQTMKPALARMVTAAKDASLDRHTPIDGRTGTSHRTTRAAVRTEAIAWGAETVPVEIKLRWRPSENEIVLAAITVIMVALVAIIALAAAAILTMG
jgi:hypothetical protein